MFAFRTERADRTVNLMNHVAQNKRLITSDKLAHVLEILYTLVYLLINLIY